MGILYTQEKLITALNQLLRTANNENAGMATVSRLLTLARDASGADEVALFVYDPSTGRVYNRSSSTSAQGGSASFALGEGLVGKVAQQGVPLLVVGEGGGSVVPLPGRTELPQALLCLPLLSQYALQGALSFVAYQSEVTWDPDDLAALQPLADHMSNLLARMDTDQQLTARREELELLSALSALPPVSADETGLLSQAANVIAELVHARYCSFLISSLDGQFVLQAGFNVRGGEHGLFPPFLQRAFREGEPLVGSIGPRTSDPLKWLSDVGNCELLLLPFAVEDDFCLLLVGLETGRSLDTNGWRALRLAASQCAHLLDNMRLYARLEQSYIDTVTSLAGSIDARDGLTKGHSEAVSQYALTFGKILGLDSRTLESLRMSSLLHDIGKIAVPDAILLKRGPLDAAEWLVMRKHPELGEKIIRGLPIADRLRPAILHHHERWDGSGYPLKLAGSDIPLLARITAIVDAYQVIVAPRPYKDGQPMAIAVAEIHRCAGTHFDPELAKVFCDRILEIDPQRSTREKYLGLFL